MSKQLSTNSNPFLIPKPMPDGLRPLSIMDRLFNKLDGNYPHKWRSAFTSEQAIQNWRESWAEAFIEEALTPHEIKAGIVACRKIYDWPPSLTEFIRACRPTLSHEQAHAEAVKQMRLREEGQDHWSSPAIYWAAVKIGAFDLFNVPYAVIKQRWQRALDEAMARTDLPEIPPRLAALPPPGRTTTTIEQGRKRMEEIMARFCTAKVIHKRIEEALS